MGNGLAELHRHHDTSHTPRSIARVSDLLDIPHFAGRSTEDIRKEVQAPPGSSWKQWYKYFKRVRKAYVSPQAVAELTRDVIRDAAGEGIELLELRISLLSTVTALMENSTKLAGKGLWPVARSTMEALLQVKHDESAVMSMKLDYVLSVSCQTKYLPFVDTYVELMRDYRDEIVGVDLTNEDENEPSTYKEAIARIRPHIAGLTIHCMETKGAERGWDALNLEPQRLGHGIRAVEDRALMEEIERRGIVLEVCPLSNINTGVATPDSHPFKRLDEAGVILTINHDGLNDDTTLNDDIVFVRTTFGYSDADMERFAANGHSNAFRNTNGRL